MGAVSISIPASSVLSEQKEYSKGNVPHGTATYDEAFSIKIAQGSFPGRESVGDVLLGYKSRHSGDVRSALEDRESTTDPSELGALEHFVMLLLVFNILLQCCSPFCAARLLTLLKSL